MLRIDVFVAIYNVCITMFASARFDVYQSSHID